MLPIKLNRYGVHVCICRSIEGCVVFEYNKINRPIILSLFKLDHSTTPDNGGILIDKNGNVFAIPTEINDFFPLAIKPEMQDAFSQYSRELTNMINEYDKKTFQIASLQAQISECKKERKQIFERGADDLAITKTYITALSNNSIMLEHIAKAIHDKRPTTRISRCAAISIQDNSIYIASQASICMTATTEEETLNTIRNFYSIDVSQYPKIFDKCKIEMEDNVGSLLTGNILYTQRLKISYFNNLTVEDIGDTIKAVKDAGVIFLDD